MARSYTRREFAEVLAKSLGLDAVKLERALSVSRETLDRYVDDDGIKGFQLSEKEWKAYGDGTVDARYYENMGCMGELLVHSEGKCVRYKAYDFKSGFGVVKEVGSGRLVLTDGKVILDDMVEWISNSISVEVVKVNESYERSYDCFMGWEDALAKRAEYHKECVEKNVKGKRNSLLLLSAVFKDFNSPLYIYDPPKAHRATDDSIDMRIDIGDFI